MVHISARYVEHVFTIRNKRVALALEPLCPLQVMALFVLGASLLNFRWKKQNTESPSTRTNEDKPRERNDVSGGREAKWSTACRDLHET